MKKFVVSFSLVAFGLAAGLTTPRIVGQSDSPGAVQKWEQFCEMPTLAYPETSWVVKLFLIAMKTPGLRDFLVSPKGLVGAMQFGVVNNSPRG